MKMDFVAIWRRAVFTNLIPVAIKHYALHWIWLDLPKSISQYQEIICFLIWLINIKAYKYNETTLKYWSIQYSYFLLTSPASAFNHAFFWFCQKHKDTIMWFGHLIVCQMIYFEQLKKTFLSSLTVMTWNNKINHSWRRHKIFISIFLLMEIYENPVHLIVFI